MHKSIWRLRVGDSCQSNAFLHVNCNERHQLQGPGRELSLFYSQVSLRGTPLGPARTVRSVLERCLRLIESRDNVTPIILRI